MNPPTNTADAVLAETAAPVEPLDALLRQIVNGYFVLTDGQGAVSKWSEPAELLFGRPSEEILGHGFFETLIGGTLPPEGQAWRAFLDLAEPPHVPGTVTLVGRRADGAEFPLEAVFVPVKLDEGFDFSLFLEDLSFELPLNLMLLRMRQQHPVVVRALRAAIEPEVQPWEGWRTAGTLVVFRPLEATPWVEAELARREAEREAADADAEERLTNPDPGIQGSFNDLDDAAAVVARLLSAVERIDELERVAGGLPAQLEEARRDAERRAAEADRAAEGLRAELSRALAGVPSELDRIEQLARIERLERGGADALEAVRAATARVEELERSAGLEELRAAVERIEGEREAARAELAAALERAEQAQSDRGAAEELARELDALREAVAHHEAIASGAVAKLDALSGMVATLNDAVSRQDVERDAATAGQIAELREALVEQLDGRVTSEQLEAALGERVTPGQLDEALADLRRRLDENAGRAPETEAVEREVQSLVGDTQRQIAALHARIAALGDGQQELEGLRARLDALVGREELDARQNELHARLEGLARREEVAALVERLDGLADGTVAEQALEAAQDALARIAQVDRGAGNVLSEVRELRAQVEAAAAGHVDPEAFARLGGEVEALRGQVAAAQDDAREAASAAGAAADAARDQAAQASDAAARAHAEASSVGDRVGRLDGRVGEISSRIESVGRDVDAVRRSGDERTRVLGEQLGDVRRELQALRAEIAGARTGADERIIALQSELTFALKSVEELKQGLSSAGQAAVIARREAEQARRAAQHVGDGSTERVTEVFQQILGLAVARNQPRRPPSVPAPSPKPEPVVREPRHGFDDVTQPMAILALDGKFKELNPAFAKLVGYKEHEFTKAAWPSPHDRRDYKDQQEALRALGAGERHEFDVQSTYMHGQGLMVPVVGKLTVSTGEDGAPQHLLLVAEDRHST
ncbi:MAG TPA: PAS domain-containing protein [Solirubrobacter sp.]|nr:PAS domain-containing protein [Solirubrobacter sp.]